MAHGTHRGFVVVVTNPLKPNLREKREQTNALRLLASSVLDRRKNHAEPKRWKWQKKESEERFWGTSPKPRMRHFWQRKGSGATEHPCAARTGPPTPRTQRRSAPQRRSQSKARKALRNEYRRSQGHFWKGLKSGFGEIPVYSSISPKNNRHLKAEPPPLGTCSSGRGSYVPRGGGFWRAKPIRRACSRCDGW